MTISSVLIFHIFAGSIGILSGAAALFFRKGSRLHAMTGNLFFISMLIMSAVAAYLAFFIPEMINVLVSIFTFYLVATAWITVKRKAGKIGLFEIGALLAVLAVGIASIVFGLEAANSVTGLKDGDPAGDYFGIAIIALLFAASDVRMIYRGGVSGALRIARHLWRMCFAWFIAVLSLFIGQPQVFPEAVRKIQFLSIPLLSVPVIAVALLTIFWLFRILLSKQYRKAKNLLQLSNLNLNV